MASVRTSGFSRSVAVLFCGIGKETVQAILEGAQQIANTTISLNTRQIPRASFAFPPGCKSGVSSQYVVVFFKGLPGPVTEGRHDELVLNHEVVAFLG